MVTTRCLPATSTIEDDIEEDEESINLYNNNNSYYQNTNNNNSNIKYSSATTEYSKNRTTTRSWPVIYNNSCRQPLHSYQQYDYETFIELNNKNNNNTSDYQLTTGTTNTKPNTFENQLSPNNNINNNNIDFDLQNSYNSKRSHNNIHRMPIPTQTQTSCVAPPPVLYLLFTLVITSSASAMLCAAIMTDHWEHVTWDKFSLDRLSNSTGTDMKWLLDGKVARLPLTGKSHTHKCVWCKVH